MTTSYGVTFGEGDGPSSAVAKYVQHSTPAADTIADTDVQTSFATTIPIPSGVQDGDVFKLTARGVITIGSPGAIQFIVSNLSSILCQTSSVLIAASPDSSWVLEALLSATSAASIESENQGIVKVCSSNKAASILEMPNTARTPTRLDIGTIKIAVVWAVADPTNTITLRQMLLERLVA